MSLLRPYFVLIVADAVGADFIPQEKTPGDSSGWAGPSEWLRDLTKFWVADGVGEGPCTSQAGREIYALGPVDRALRPRLERLRRKRFGDVLSVDVGDMWPAKSLAGPFA